MECTAVLRDSDNRSRTKSGRLASYGIASEIPCPPLFASPATIICAQCASRLIAQPCDEDKGLPSTWMQRSFQWLPGRYETVTSRQIPRGLSANRTAAPELDPGTDVDAPSKHMPVRGRSRAITGMYGILQPGGFRSGRRMEKSGRRRWRALTFQHYHQLQEGFGILGAIA